MLSHRHRFEAGVRLIGYVAIFALHLRVTVGTAHALRIQMNVVRKFQPGRFYKTLFVILRNADNRSGTGFSRQQHRHLERWMILGKFGNIGHTRLWVPGFQILMAVGTQRGIGSH